MDDGRVTEPTPPEARAGLADAFSLWRMVPGTVDSVIEAATSCLVAGMDSPGLRELAGASPRESPFVLEPLIEETLVELGMRDVLSSNVHRAALAVMLRRLRARQITERELARWAHTHIGHDGDDRCQVFVDFEDVYDTIEYTAHSPDDLDHWLREEADAFLRGLPEVPENPIWRVAAVIRAPRRWSRRFVVRVLPGGREFSAGGWDDVWSTLPELRVPWRNVSFESDDVRALVLKRWGDHPDAPS